jgi:broad specificity phosphatase PhoE
MTASGSEPVVIDPEEVAAQLVAESIRRPVWLVRHAPTSWTGVRWCGRADPPVTPEGRRIAQQLGRDLAREIVSPVEVWTSPLRRAAATAEALVAASAAAGLPLDLIVDPDLTEVDVGRIEGLTWDELIVAEPALADAILAGRRVEWPGGEATLDVDRRAARVAHRLVAASVDRSIVVVSHGGFLHALATALAVSTGHSPLAPLSPGGIVRLVPGADGIT